MIIGINGVKHSGKSTAADYLIEEYGFRAVSFAQPMKDSVAALFDIRLQDIEAMKNDSAATVTLTFPNGMRATMSFRTFLQRYGTEAHRDIPEFGRNVWVDMAEDKMQDVDQIVIADVRFDNEAVVIHRCGGTVLRIDRKSVQTDDAHESESGLSPHLIDGVLDNNATLDHLYAQLDAVVVPIHFRENHGTD